MAVNEAFSFVVGTGGEVARNNFLLRIGIPFLCDITLLSDSSGGGSSNAREGAGVMVGDEYRLNTPSTTIRVKIGFLPSAKTSGVIACSSVPLHAVPPSHWLTRLAVDQHCEGFKSESPSSNERSCSWSPCVNIFGNSSCCVVPPSIRTWEHAAKLENKAFDISGLIERSLPPNHVCTNM